MRFSWILNASQSSVILGSNVAFPWQGTADWIAVENPTNSDIWLSTTGPHIPTSAGDAQHIVPAGKALVLPIGAQAIGVRFADVVALANSTGGGQLTTAFILVGKQELPPNFSDFSFVTLSSSQLSAGVETVTVSGTIKGPYDLGAFGGILVLIAPSNAAGQCQLTYQVSADGITWTTADTIALWPGIIYSLQFPRYQRYGRFQIDSIAASVFSLNFIARATLTEIQQLDISSNQVYVQPGSSLGAGLQVIGIPISVVGIPNISITMYMFAPGVSISTLFIIEVSNDQATWVAIQNETLQLSGGNVEDQYYCVLPFRANFVRFRVNNLTGQTLGFILTAVPSFDPQQLLTNTAAYVRARDGDIITLGSAPDTAANSTIMGRLVSAINNLIIMEGQLTTLSNELVTIQGQLTTIATDLSTQITQLSTLSTQLGQILTALSTVMAVPFVSSIAAAAGGAFVDYGVVPSGKMLGFSLSSNGATNTFIRTGSAVAANGDFIWGGNIAANESTPFICAPNHYFRKPAAGDHIWGNSNVAGTQIAITALFE